MIIVQKRHYYCNINDNYNKNNRMMIIITAIISMIHPSSENKSPFNNQTQQCNLNAK